MFCLHLLFPSHVISFLRNTFLYQANSSLTGLSSSRNVHSIHPTQFLSKTSLHQIQHFLNMSLLFTIQKLSYLAFQLLLLPRNLIKHHYREDGGSEFMRNGDNALPICVTSLPHNPSECIQHQYVDGRMAHTRRINKTARSQH
jgi:hypothetical protein